jgi:hypothetical protein
LIYIVLLYKIVTENMKEDIEQNKPPVPFDEMLEAARRENWGFVDKNITIPRNGSVGLWTKVCLTLTRTFATGQ